MKAKRNITISISSKNENVHTSLNANGYSSIVEIIGDLEIAKNKLLVQIEKNAIQTIEKLEKKPTGKK